MENTPDIWEDFALDQKIEFTHNTLHMENTPDNWVVVKVGKDLYKVLAGWSGGYLDSDRWKLNSGISEVKDDGDHWLFISESGSVYKCHKGGYGTRHNNYGILKQLLEIDGTELMDGKTDWMKLV